MTQYRPELPVPPRRIARLPLDHRGYPVPYFVAYVNGVPDHRIVDQQKFKSAVENRLCWTCGQTLGTYLSFVIGPMCAVNRVGGDGPNHLECADYTVKACPFLSRPHMVRRESGLPEAAIEHRKETGLVKGAGLGHPRNPGVMLIWTTRSYKLQRVNQPGAGSGYLFALGDPIGWDAWREGRRATQEELSESFYGGVEILRGMARSEGNGAEEELDRRVAEARTLLKLEAVPTGRDVVQL